MTEIYLHNKYNVILLLDKHSTYIDFYGTVLAIPTRYKKIKNGYTKIGEFEE